jgi:hypothetical protein
MQATILSGALKGVQKGSELMCHFSAPPKTTPHFTIPEKKFLRYNFLSFLLYIGPGR